MKLDLVQINKLSPPGLWDVQVLSALIACLVQVKDGGIGPRLVYGRMIDKFSQELREKIHANLNMRIKAWVLICPARIIWVRQIIGEAAIRKWQKNRLADYALSKYFGDWRAKFSGGFVRPNGGEIRKPQRMIMRTIMHKIRAYNWKPFALAKIANVERLLFGRHISKTNAGAAIEGMVIEDMRAAYFKLWGVNMTDENEVLKWQQPRASRKMKPVEFTPQELAPEEVNGAQDVVEKVVGERKSSSDSGWGILTYSPIYKSELEPELEPEHETEYGFGKTAIKKPP